MYTAVGNIMAVACLGIYLATLTLTSYLATSTFHQIVISCNSQKTQNVKCTYNNNNNAQYIDNFEQVI